jgi:hypothetical protein
MLAVPDSHAGGDNRDRTDDLLLAKQALSQLSYIPESNEAVRVRTRATEPMVGLGRFELPTSRLSGVRSNQLSYRPRKGQRGLARPRDDRIACKPIPGDAYLDPASRFRAEARAQTCVCGKAIRILVSLERR